MYVSKRIDGSFETLVNGLPYHVTGDDPEFKYLSKQYPNLPPGMAIVDGVLTEDNRGKSGWVNGEPVAIQDFGPLPEGWSDTPPPPTQEEVRAAAKLQFTAAIQERLDAFARTRNYDGVDSMAKYIGCSVPKFSTEAEYMRDKVAETWAESYEILAAVEAGTRAMPALEEVLAELPKLAWPEV